MCRIPYNKGVLPLVMMGLRNPLSSRYVHTDDPIHMTTVGLRLNFRLKAAFNISQQRYCSVKNDIRFNIPIVLFSRGR